MRKSPRVPPPPPQGRQYDGTEVKLGALALLATLWFLFAHRKRREGEPAAALFAAPPWREEGLDERERFEATVKAAPRLVAYLEGTEEPQRIYGLYKQATCGDAPADGNGRGGGLKGRLKRQAWLAQVGKTAVECRVEYVSLVDMVAMRTTAAAAAQAADSRPRGLALRPARCRDMNLRVRIVGTGRYLPERIVTNAEVASRCGSDASLNQRSGVVQRRQAAPDETAVELAARASRAALEAAGVSADGLWAIINASGTTAQAIPDGGPLLQAALGLGSSGVRAVSVHATCLSFLVAFEVAASWLARADCPPDAHVLISCSEITSRHVDPTDAHTACLFGDAAVAVVLRRATRAESSRMHAARMETYGSGASLTQARGGGTTVPAFLPDGVQCSVNPRCDFAANHFEMDGPGTLKLVLERGPAFLERLRPRLSSSLMDIRWAVPHQASGLALDAIEHALGWPADRMLRTLDQLGNTVAASIPLTLHEGISSGKIRRGDKVVMFGTGAGLSFGGVVITY